MEKIKCDACNRSFDTNEALNQHKSAMHRYSVSVPVGRKRKLAKGKVIGVLVVILLVPIIGYFSFTAFVTKPTGPGEFDGFAQCLTESGAVFYGAYWCHFCEQQKDMFGSSMKFVNYVECDPRGKNAQPELCAENNIRGYPTWIIDGKSYTGVQSLDKLSELTGCPLILKLDTFSLVLF